MSNVRVVILAAGKGKRMGSSIPKPLLPILGKPIIAHMIETLRDVVESKPIVVVSPEGEPQFRQILGDVVEYAVQEEARGTGDAVRAAKELYQDADGVMVLYGDHPFLPAEVLKNLVQIFNKDPQAMVMLTARVPNFEGNYANFITWGRILYDANGKVLGVRESKDTTEEEKQIREVNPGMYVFPRAWLDEALPRLKNENASQEYYLTDLLPLACADGLMIKTLATDALHVIGVNTPEELRRAEALQHELKK